MQERLRLISVSTGDQDKEALRDYELQLYEGEICYVQGIPGSGVRTLVQVLAGERPLKEGRILLSGRELTEEDRRHQAWEQGVYMITSRENLVDEMTVGDNLEALRPVRHILGGYHPGRAAARVSAYLLSQQVNIPADAFVWSLSESERSQLSILKGRLHGAQVIILDATEEPYEGREALQLCDLILRMRGEGVTFLILSESFSEFARIADRIQWLENGRDRKEWNNLTEDSLRVLKGQRGGEKHRYMAGGDRIFPEGEYPRGRESSQAVQEPTFLGLYDFEWETAEGFHRYLETVQSQCPALWQEYIRAALPPEGSWRSRDAVLIPVESADLLVENESIADNLILPIAKRVAYRKLGYISPAAKRSIRDTFLKKFGIHPRTRRVDELSRVQRKILSIYRYELDRPEVIFLEAPYSGLEPDQIQILRNYLRTLSRKGIRVICSSKSRESLQADCQTILVTENGKGGKITSR